MDAMDRHKFAFGVFSFSDFRDKLMVGALFEELSSLEQINKQVPIHERRPDWIVKL